jgi:uncharacterized membrane protein YphA (DoxX/SURF4 family)
MPGSRLRSAGPGMPSGRTSPTMVAPLERREIDVTWRRASISRTRAAHLAVANTRILLGFAFLPAGLKKLLNEPFTDPANTGAFHEFLHAFYATGWFYQFVGVVQLTAAAMLLTQRHAATGALIALPVLTAITALCWSTQVYPTAAVATLMLAANAALLAWDAPIGRRADAGEVERSAPARAPIDLSLWERCGGAIFVAYLAATAAAGEVYRPEGVELDAPAFYLLPALALFPVVTWLLDRRRHRRAGLSERTPRDRR